jgi:hypothetical protein
MPKMPKMPIAGGLVVLGDGLVILGRASLRGVIFDCDPHPRLGGVGSTIAASGDDEEDVRNVKVRCSPSSAWGHPLTRRRLTDASIRYPRL